MKAYILGTSCISPQKTFVQESFLGEPLDYTTPYLSCVEPVYKEYINPILARRLSRYIKMGVTTALGSLKDAKCEMPGAIITGTGLGSTEDNEKILQAMYEYQENLINPTHFIQSTHNTISSQIAIMLKCHNYNTTYVHRGFSFETALLDALLLLSEGLATTALAGGVDAITEGHYRNYARIGRWRTGEVHSLKMIDAQGPGVVPGEGSAHFLLSSAASENAYARIDGLELIYKPASGADILRRTHEFLHKNQLSPADIDLVIMGNNGDPDTDRYYAQLAVTLFPSNSIGAYKHLCGEYETAGAFALWMAAMILKRQVIPEVVIRSGKTHDPIKHLLIYTHHRGDQHALYLLGKV